MAVLIAVPVFGQHDYTHALVSDLEREGADYVIVDNRGDYPKISNERVVTPGYNLGWAGGSELGFRLAFSEGYSHGMTLNNDTRISKGFVAGLIDPRLPDDAGIIGPMVDHGFLCAEAEQKVDAADYVPRPKYRTVPAVEGVAFVLSRECWLKIGGMDLRSFGRYGWGIDLDLVLRARDAGFGCYTTEMAYINHFGRGTAKVTFGKKRYEFTAEQVMNHAMRKYHGLNWKKRFPPGTLPVPGWKKTGIAYTTHQLES